MQPSDRIRDPATYTDGRLGQLECWIGNLHTLRGLGGLTAGAGLIGLALHQPLAALVVAGVLVAAIGAGGSWLACELRRERVDDLIVRGVPFESPAKLVVRFR
jgi:hypothetical protein